MREVYNLEQAYQLAQDYEKLQKMPITRRPKPSRSEILDPRPSMSLALTGPKPNMRQTPGSRPYQEGWEREKKKEKYLDLFDLT